LIPDEITGQGQVVLDKTLLFAPREKFREQRKDAVGRGWGVFKFKMQVFHVRQNNLGNDFIANMRAYMVFPK
jgi:hypothetical protein